MSDAQSTGGFRPVSHSEGANPPVTHPDAILPPPMSAQTPVDPAAELNEAWTTITRKVTPANRAWLTNSQPVTMHLSLIHI